MPRAGLVMPLLVLVAAAASTCRAQSNPRSPPGAVSGVVAGTHIDITFHRPVARGRELFGSLVPWDRVWSPSSDTAALFTASTPIRVNGGTLSAGTYSLWTIPGRDAWTIIFSAAHPTHHMRYRSDDDALRVRAVPRSGESRDTLAFYFPRVEADSAELVLHWGRTVVPLAIHALP